VPASADGDSAARTEADDAHILKDCPCCSKPLGEEGRFYLAAWRLIEYSHQAANITQHFRSIGDSKSLIGGDGINKTMV
jgi:hypothetical protein